MARVCWRVIKTGTMGQGQPMPRRDAELEAAYLGTQYPDIEHWVEPVT